LRESIRNPAADSRSSWRRAWHASLCASVEPGTGGRGEGGGDEVNEEFGKEERHGTC
jgi:hypothetical protein